MVSRAVSPSLIGEKPPEADFNCARRGRGVLSCTCLTRDAILPWSYGNSVQLIRLAAVASPLARRAVSVLLSAPLVATLPDARGLACVKTEQGLQAL